SGFIYFQMWPVMFAILNYAANYWLQSQSGGTPLVLANKDVVALQHSDVANLAGYLSLSIPVLSFYLTKGAAAMGSQVAGSVLSSGAFTSAGVAATTADGNWSFNNMSMDNVSQNKMDTNLMQRQGQQTWQADNGSTQTQTAGGHTVIDGSGAMSNLPVNMKLSQLASSGFQESARQSQVQAQTALDGYNHSVTSGWSQLSQLSHQTGTSDSLNQGSENSQATNATRGAGMMLSASESYAKANNISTQEAYNKLMDISNQGSLSAGIKGTAGGGLNLGVVKFGAEGSVSGDLRHSTGSSRGVQDSGSQTQDSRHDQNSQAVNDFRQGMDMVKSSRITDGANHSENAASSNVQQLAATLNDAESQYHQYTTSSTQSNEFSRMATVAQNQSASLDTNYTQEFVDWAANKYGDKAQSMLTSAPSAREAAMEFVNERLKPEIMGDYQKGRSDLTSGQEHAAFSGEHIVQPARGSQQVSGSSGHDAGVSYSSQDGGAHRSGGVGSAQTYGTAQGAEYGGQQGGNYSARTDDSVSPGMEQSTVHQGQAAGQRSSSGNIISSAGMAVAGGRSTADERTGHIAESHQEFHHSGAVREQGSMHGQESEVTHSRSGINAGGEKVRGDAMQESYRENQAKLHEHSSQGFGPQNELQRRVAEQRSENEHKINESAGEIGKKQSTVQASSDILKGENLNATGNFKIQRKEAEIDQQTPVIDSAEKRKLEEQLLELRKRAS
ncbi:TPA: conjugal transfer mating pair stabilization protein TraG, partial [Enterobacter hormaechei]|nr:conjugal transfer mating pair stabilization protein TraG [Enterobacter hormaechei]